MLDLETLSTRPHAAILVIAGIRFNRNEEKTPRLKKMDTFYRRIQIDSCTKLGMHVDPETQEWWDVQDSKIKEEAFGNSAENPRVPLKQALQEFTQWFGNSKCLWSHGAVFDCVIMDEAYLRCGLTPPWKFWNERDTRTLYEIAGVKNWDLPKNSKHHALHDCYRQIVGVHMSMNRLRVEKP